MEKIKLDSKVFKIIPMGIETNIFDKSRRFSFVSDSSYAEIEIAFGINNISKIEYLSKSDEQLKIYTDCIALKSLTKEFYKQVEDGVIADVYTVVLEIQ